MNDPQRMTFPQFVACVLLGTAIALAANAVFGQELVPVQCWGGGCCPQGGCCPPQQYYYQQPRQQPRERPQPDGVETPPVGAPGTPKFEPLGSPPQPTTPAMPPQKPAPTFDWDAWDKKNSDDHKAMLDRIAALEKQLSQVRECDCNGCCDKLRAELNAKIETLAKSQVIVSNDVKILQASQPNYDTIAAEVQKRLTHSATITMLDGSHKTQTKPLSQPLEFIQHSRGVK